MPITVAILASLGFIGWVIYRAVRGKPIKAHVISYAVACITGVFTLAYFLSMDIPQLIKIVVSILLGIVLIVVATALQHRRQQSKQ